MSLSYFALYYHSYSVSHTEEVNYENSDQNIFCDLVPFLIDSLCVSLRVVFDDEDNKEHDDKKIADSEEVE